MEEAGELLHALLKVEQRRIWGQEGRYKNLEHDVKDAIGDCIIYACSLCNADGVDFREIMDWSNLSQKVAGQALRASIDLVEVASRIAGHSFKRGVDTIALTSYIKQLRAISAVERLDFDAVVSEVWERVKNRVK